MEIVRGSINIRTESQFEVIDITSKVAEWLRSIGAEDGLLVVYAPHTTAAITINEPESGLRQDIVDVIKEYFRPGGSWRHNLIDDNAHAHLAASFMGNSRVIPVAGGSMTLGTWQAIMFVEMDGPRQRRAELLFIGGRKPKVPTQGA